MERCHDYFFFVETMSDPLANSQADRVDPTRAQPTMVNVTIANEKPKRKVVKKEDSLRNENNRELAAAFLNALEAYRDSQDNYVKRTRQTAQQKAAAQAAERQSVMTTLGITGENANAEYERRADLARRFNQRYIQTAAGIERKPVQQLTAAQKQDRKDYRANPRIILTRTYDNTLKSDEFRGYDSTSEHAYTDRSDKFDTYNHKTLRKLTPTARHDVKRTFGEWVGLLGFAPEYHPELLMKKSAKVFLRDPDESKYVYVIYDMDDDYRTPGTLWIYQRIPGGATGEVYAVGGYIIGKSATSKDSVNLLSEMHYYNEHETAAKRREVHKKEWLIDNNYITMKPVPAFFKELAAYIVDTLTDANRPAPKAGAPTYVVFHDVDTKQPDYSVVGKVTPIAWNTIINRIVQLYMLYFVYPQLNLVNAGKYKASFLRKMNSLIAIRDTPKEAANKNNSSESKKRDYTVQQSFYHLWRHGSLNAEVEKRLLNDRTFIADLTDIYERHPPEDDESFLPESYMGRMEDQSPILDALTSVVVLYFTNNPLTYLNKGRANKISNESFENTPVIFRFCTEEEREIINAQIAIGDTVSYGMTSKQVAKVYQSLNVRVMGTNLIERRDGDEEEEVEDDGVPTAVAAAINDFSPTLRERLRTSIFGSEPARDALRTPEQARTLAQKAQTEKLRRRRATGRKTKKTSLSDTESTTTTTSSEDAGPRLMEVHRSPTVSSTSSDLPLYNSADLTSLARTETPEIPEEDYNVEV